MYPLAMTFNDFRFKPGLQTTIRRGIKWMPASGEDVRIADESGEVKGAIRVEMTVSSRFYAVADDAINAWHAEAWPDGMRQFSRKFRVSEALERCYRMPLFDAGELVTVVWFRVIDLHGKTGSELEAMLEGRPYKQGGQANDKCKD